MKTLSIASTLSFAGCAILANVTPIGDGASMAVVRSNDVNARVPEEQAKAMSQATAFCADRGASVDVIELVAATPPPGQPPSAEVDFRCEPGERWRVGAAAMASSADDVAALAA